MSPQDQSAQSPHRRVIGRRPLLRAAGLGAGVAAAGLLGGLPAQAASRRVSRTVAAPSSSLPLVGGAEFPIGLFWPPPPYYMSERRYQDIADAGFNFVISGNYLFDVPSAQYALGLAEQAGLRMLIADDPRILMLAQYLTITDDQTVSDSMTVSDATAQVAAALADYTSYSSFAGFNLFDEPAPALVPNLGTLTGIMRELAPDLLPYSNLVAYTSVPGPVADYIQDLQPSLISFDRYPILTSGIDIGYFSTWLAFRQAALQAGIPAWTYIQSVAYTGHVVPTASQLAWQVNVSLAYGCSGIQYFTYWTPDPARGSDFSGGIILPDGTPSPLYAAAKELNNHWLRPAGQQLKPLTSESVQHANDQATVSAVGVAPFTPGDYLTDVTGDAVIVGLFSATPDDGTRWLLVTNRDPDVAASAQVSVNTATVTAVTRFVPHTGTYVSARTLPVRLAPGAAALYRLAVS